MSKDYDFLFKVLAIGDSSVGKTCILFRFCEDKFNPDFVSTIGIDFKMRSLVVAEKRIKLQIWDTAGQERFRTITTAYYRGAMGIILVFDVTNRKSFENIIFWLKTVEDYASPDVIKFIMGNKIDMENRQVTFDEAHQFASQHGARYLEVSAKTGDNIFDSFILVSSDIKAAMDKKIKMEPTQNDGLFNIHEQSASDRGGSCC